MKQGDVISYLDMCREEEVNLQRGMNYHLHGRHSILLMSLRKGAPYADRVEDEGQVLIYEGHNESRRRRGPDPKTVDQPAKSPNGRLTQNALFLKAVDRFKAGKEAERVKVYEKIQNGIWVYNGFFDLIDAWLEDSGNRRVFKFKLRLSQKESSQKPVTVDLEHDRIIPTVVKLTVWKRDKGCCIKCGKRDNLHFDHLLPYSLGGTSLLAENIQLLCARHNLQKHNRIE